MKILGIDPGPEKSAAVVWNSETQQVPECFYEENTRLRNRYLADDSRATHVAIEGMHYQAMPMNRDMKMTAIWIGRFYDWFWSAGMSVTYDLTSNDARCHLTRQTNLKEKEIKQALIWRFGGQDKVIGGGRCKTCNGKGWRGRDHRTCDQCAGTKWEYPPGEFYKIAKFDPAKAREHLWSALALAVTYADKNQEEAACG
jgi:hypothetical protein